MMQSLDAPASSLSLSQTTHS